MAYVIVGLGNPEIEYRKTRHNAGRMAVERLQKLYGFPEFKEKKIPASKVTALLSEGELHGEKVQLVLPQVSMNLSGKVMGAFVKSIVASKRVMIIRDELDMPLGAMKMTVGRGSGGHKGVESIARAIKSKAFAQIKIGISGETAKGLVRKPKGEEKVVKHVLGKFKSEEETRLKKEFSKIADAVEAFVADDTSRALLIANTK